MRKRLTLCGMFVVLAVFLSGCEASQAFNQAFQQAGQDFRQAMEDMQETETQPVPEQETPSVPEQSEEPTAEVTAHVPSEPVVTRTEPPSSIYTELSDEEFAFLTELVAKSFYSLTLSMDDYEAMREASAVSDCLEEILVYAGNNYFEIDPEYKAAFAVRYDSVAAIPNFDQLTENFMIDRYWDAETGEWSTQITSYSLNPNDVVEYDNTLYIDAEGYLQKGVTVYRENDGKMEEAGEIKDIAFDKEINGVTYPYALNVEFFGDPDGSGWRDGEHFLTFNKQLCGKPAYYVEAIDANRSVKKQIIDYSGDIRWKPLDERNAKNGTAVYFGATAVKSPIFTIIEVDPSNDVMKVEYPSGSVETKSFSAMLNNGYLYVK